MKELKQSETRVIKRFQINLNPINPKRHSDEKVKLQKKNLQKVGFLGGIVWNEKSGNLIDGHRRIKAMDLYYKYDGTPSTDYDVKVEVVNLDDKVDFCKVAEGLGCKAIRVSTKEEVAPAIKEALDTNGPVLIEVMIGKDDKVFPMVAPGGAISKAFDESDLKNK